MANNTTEYKFKVTNNLDKDSTIIKKFNFYIGLPYSKRKYRYMRVINFATNKEGQHLFNVVLGHSESAVAAMTEDILRSTHASLKPVTTNISRITYTSLNVGTIGLVCNDKNEEIIKNGDWTGISGEYMKVKSFRTNGNDNVLGLIFDAADRSLVSARKNDNTNVVAKPEAPVDIVKVPQPDEVKLEPILLTSAARKAIKDSVDDLRKTIRDLEQKVKDRDQNISELEAHIADDDNSIQKQYELIQGYMVTIKDLEDKNEQLLELLKKRDDFISKLSDETDSLNKANSELHQQMEYWEEYIAELKRENEVQGDQLEQMEDRVNELGSKPDETQKTFRDKFIDLIVDMFREKLETLTDDELLRYRKE